MIPQAFPMPRQHISLLLRPGRGELHCLSLTSLKQYLNPACWVNVPPPLSVWAWTAGAGAPAVPEEEEEESVRRVGLYPDTFSTWWIFTLASGGCSTRTFTMDGLGAPDLQVSWFCPSGRKNSDRVSS